LGGGHHWIVVCFVINSSRRRRAASCRKLRAVSLHLKADPVERLSSSTRQAGLTPQATHAPPPSGSPSLGRSSSVGKSRDACFRIAFAHLSSAISLRSRSAPRARQRSAGPGVDPCRLHLAHPLAQRLPRRDRLASPTRWRSTLGIPLASCCRTRPHSPARDHSLPPVEAYWPPHPKRCRRREAELPSKTLRAASRPAGRRRRRHALGMESDRSPGNTRPSLQQHRATTRSRRR
jgi:hypothetical protein